MKSKKVFSVLVLVLCTVFVCPVSLEAIGVGLDDFGRALVLGAISGEVSVPVDKVTGDSVFELCKTFDSPPDGGLFTPIVVEFEEISPAVTANIVICDGRIVSDTGTEWFDFHMNLHAKMLDLQAGFDQEFIPGVGQLEEVYYGWDCGYEELPGKLNFVNTVCSGVPSLPYRERTGKYVY